MRLLIAPPGQSIFTTENKDFIFNSDLATHMIQSIVAVNMTSPATSFTITHGLGFAPKVWIMGFDSVNSLYYRVPYLTTFDKIVDYYITDTQIVIEASSYGASLALKVMIFTRSFKP